MGASGLRTGDPVAIEPVQDLNQVMWAMHVYSRMKRVDSIRYTRQWRRNAHVPSEKRRPLPALLPNS